MAPLHHTEREAERRADASPEGAGSRRGTADDKVDRLADEARSRTGHTGLLAFLLGAIIAVAAALLVVQNRQNVEIEWLVWDVDGSMWFVLALAFAAGFVTSPLLWLGFRHAQIRRRRREALIDQVSRRRAA